MNTERIILEGRLTFFSNSSKILEILKKSVSPIYKITHIRKITYYLHLIVLALKIFVQFKDSHLVPTTGTSGQANIWIKIALYFNYNVQLR